MMADERAFRSFEGVSVRFAQRIRQPTFSLSHSLISPQIISLSLVHRDDRKRGYNLL